MPITARAPKTMSLVIRGDGHRPFRPGKVEFEAFDDGRLVARTARRNGREQTLVAEGVAVSERRIGSDETRYTTEDGKVWAVGGCGCGG